MTQLIDLIEDISIFRKTEDSKDYYSGARSFRQIDKSTIEAVCHVYRSIDDFTIKTNLNDVTIKDVSVSYNRIYTIRFLSVDLINNVCECTCESYIDTDSIEVYAFNYEKKYRNELERQVTQQLESIPDPDRPTDKLDQVIIELKNLEFIEDSSDPGSSELEKIEQL